jgi:hypothetical protein
VKRSLIVVVAIFIAVTGCNRMAPAPANDAAPMAVPRAMAEGEAAKAMAPAPPPSAGSPVAPTPPGAVAVPAERKIIRNGSLTLEVRRLDDALSAIRSAAEKAGGYVTNESQGKDQYGARHGMITCRVPAASLDRTLAQFQTLGRVEGVNVTAEDITEQYFNLEIRLRNQRDLETRFRALLDKPGNKVSDLLEIEREMARVRGEIDELEGRRRFWDSQVSLSTLTIQLHEPRPAIVGEGGGILGTLKSAFRRLGENLVETIAWLIASLGVIVPALLALWIAWRLWRALRSRRGRTGKPAA